MNLIIIRLAFVIFMMLISSCKMVKETSFVTRQSSKANRLTLILEGEQRGNQIFPSSIFLEDVTKARTRFVPFDPVSVEESSFTIRPAWSPGNQWLLLPNGRFDGFIGFKAKDLPAGLIDRSNTLAIGVCDLNGTKWWHEFSNWKSSSVFVFKAGLSGQFFLFECDLTTGVVKSVNMPPIVFQEIRNHILTSNKLNDGDYDDVPK